MDENAIPSPMAAAGTEAAIELLGVRKSFGDVAAVRELSLAIPRGSVYGFIGPNGAGKTTTIRMIMDIIAPDAGEILFMGAPRSRRDTERIGYLPEERGLYKKMKVGWTLEYFARLKGMRDKAKLRSEVDRWLERFDLLERKRSNVEALSKGNQQKVQFVTTILHDPELVILDEPFSGLDPVNTELLADIIGELRARGRTVIFATHVMEQAEKLCEYVFMIKGGAKVLDGRLADIKARFGRGSYAVQLAGDPAELLRLPCVERGERPGGGAAGLIELYLREGAAMPELLAALAPRRDVRKVERVEPSLHDIFVEVARARDEAAAEGGAAAGPER